MNKSRPQNQQDDNSKVIKIRRVSKKTKGGNKASFTALVVVGDKKGQVGLGLGKAPSVADAIKKGSRLARRDMVVLPLVNGTIPFQIEQKFKGAHILMKPAPEGTGVIAGGVVRNVVEMAGVTDIVAKCLGGANKASNAVATFRAMAGLERISHRLRSLEKFKPKTKIKTKAKK
jgi:small subunit ribosomal protein S5